MYIYILECDMQIMVNLSLARLYISCQNFRLARIHLPSLFKKKQSGLNGFLLVTNDNNLHSSRYYPYINAITGNVLGAQ